MCVVRKILVDFIDLVLEAFGKHLICLVEDKHSNVIRLQLLPVDHVVHSARSARDDLDSMVQLKLVSLNALASSAAMNADATVVSKSK